MTSGEHPFPSDEEVRAYFETCTNWGRWGDDDSAGTVNLVTPEKRREAAALVRTGRAVSLARRLNTQGGPGNWNPAQHYLQVGPQFSADYLGMFFHGYATTHIDALCHIFWDGKMWNGKPSSNVTSGGARSGAVDAWSTGIATRGVLIDIPRFRGTPHVTLDAPVRGWEMEAAAACNAAFKEEIATLFKSPSWMKGWGPFFRPFSADQAVSFTYPGYLDELLARYKKPNQSLQPTAPSGRG